jgi:hypothetical protein
MHETPRLKRTLQDDAHPVPTTCSVQTALPAPQHELLEFVDLNGPASRSPFSFDELIVNPFPWSAPRRSAIVTEPVRLTGRAPLLIRTATGYQ